jgi:hypothetical protein
VFVIGGVQPCACKAFTRLGQAIGAAEASVRVAALWLSIVVGQRREGAIRKDEHLATSLHTDGTNLIVLTRDDVISFWGGRGAFGNMYLEVRAVRAISTGTLRMSVVWQVAAR